MAYTDIKKYKDIKSQIYDLDIIFFRGNELVSKAIVELEKAILGTGEWSHVGLVISKRHLKTINLSITESKDTLYIWESTMSSTNKIITADPSLDVESGKGVFGVQIRRLDDVIKNSLKNGVCIGWGRLLNNPLIQRVWESDVDFDMRLDEIEIKLGYLHGLYQHRPYPLNVLRIIRSLFESCHCIEPLDDTGSVFCSQFVAIVYQYLGILEKRFDTGEIVPVDLSNPEFSREKVHQIVDNIVTLIL